MMMNLLEIEDAVKGMSDQQLLQEAMNPSGNIPQFLIVSEKQNRDKVRKEYAQNKPQEGTVAQRIMAGDSGIMGAMPQQMAMAPQMPQRMPQMPPPQTPPQGIQQAMPPQRMAGGGIVRMAEGGRTKQILDLVAVGLTPVELVERGFGEEEIASAVAQYSQMMAPTESTFSGSSSIVGAPPRSDPTIQRRPSGFFDDPGDPLTVGPFIRENIMAPVGEAVDYVSEIPGRVAQSARMAEARSPISDNLLLASDFGGDGKSSGSSSGFLPYANVARQGTDFGGMFSDVLDAIRGPYDRFMARSDRVAERAEDKPVVSPGGIADTQQGSGSVPAEKLGLLQIDPSTNQLAGDEVLVPNDKSGAYKAIDEKGGYDAARVDYGDATLPSLPSTGSGADLAASNLESLMSIIEERSARNSATSKGLALANIGAGMIEGKTGQGIRDATKILSEDAKAQGQAQMEMARLRTADAREGQKLALMKQDLINKLGITDRQSAMAALKSLGDDIRILSADRAYMMTQEGKDAVGRLIEQQKLLRAMLVPDVFPKIDPEKQVPTSPQPSGVDLSQYRT
jgi:hypothetical protein